MKNNIILFCVLLTSIFSFGQDSKDLEQKKEELRAAKVAFITSELELTSSEAQAFWPIYNAYEEQQFALRKRPGGKRANFEERLKAMSDKEADALLQQFQETDEKLHQSRMKLVQDLKPIISSKKLILLKKAEDDFNRKLLHQYRKNKQKP